MRGASATTRQRRNGEGKEGGTNSGRSSNVRPSCSNSQRAPFGAVKRAAAPRTALMPITNHVEVLTDWSTQANHTLALQCMYSASKEEKQQDLARSKRWGNGDVDDRHSSDQGGQDSLATPMAATKNMDVGARQRGGGKRGRDGEWQQWKTKDHSGQSMPRRQHGKSTEGVEMVESAMDGQQIGAQQEDEEQQQHDGQSNGCRGASLGRDEVRAMEAQAAKPAGADEHTAVAGSLQREPKTTRCTQKSTNHINNLVLMRPGVCPVRVRSGQQPRPYESEAANFSPSSSSSFSSSAAVSLDSQFSAAIDGDNGEVCGTPSYPSTVNGFLEGLADGLRMVDGGTLWQSAKGVSRLVIEPLTHIGGNGSGEESTFSDGFDLSTESKRSELAAVEAQRQQHLSLSMPEEEKMREAKERTARHQSLWTATEDVIAVRNPSAWRKKTKTITGADTLALSTTRVKLLEETEVNVGERRREKQDAMNRKKQSPAKQQQPPQPQQHSGDPLLAASMSALSSENGKSCGGRKAEVGSAIDLRKLKKAKKVQVFCGGGMDIMVVGAKRIVVVDAIPTKEYSHYGVVSWMTQLENVKNVTLEIQPCVVSPSMSMLTAKPSPPPSSSASPDAFCVPSSPPHALSSSSAPVTMNVVLRVSVKRGMDYCFVVSMKDSSLLVQSIYARLNGESPPRIASSPKEIRSTPGEDGKESCKHQQQAGQRQGQQSAAIFETDEQQRMSSVVANAIHERSEPPAPEASLLSPASASDTVDAPAGVSSAPHDRTISFSPREDIILLSPRQHHKLQQRRQQSRVILSPKSTMDSSLGPSFIVTSVSTPHMVPNTSITGAKTASVRASDIARERHKKYSKQFVTLSPTLAKFATMLQHHVPESAVCQKLVAEGEATEGSVGELLVALRAHATAMTAVAAAVPLDSQVYLSSSAHAGADAATRGGLKTISNAQMPQNMEQQLQKEPSPQQQQQQQQQSFDRDRNSVLKYQSMLKAGVPSPAVQQKLRSDGIKPHLIDVAMDIDFSAPPPPVLSASPSLSSAFPLRALPLVLSDSEEASIKKFRSMAKAGVPLPAVQMKMSFEGITDGRLIAAICGGDKAADALTCPFRRGAKERTTSEGGASGGCSASGAGLSLSAEEEKLVSKYRSMIKAGVPAQAVQNKMKVEGLAPKLITAVVGGDGKETKVTKMTANIKTASNLSLSAEEEKLVSKYRSMIKAGVPAQAVQNKMKVEGLAPKLITAVVGGDGKETKVTKMTANIKTASNLMTLHWTPLEVSEEQFNQTVWAKSRGGKKIRRTAGNVLSPEMLKLERLFSKKKPAAEQSADRVKRCGGARVKTVLASEESKPKVKSVLDNTRAQNLDIALRAFKDTIPTKTTTTTMTTKLPSSLRSDTGSRIGSSDGAEMRGAAGVAILLGRFDVDALSTEQLTRLQEMLPTEAEVRSVVVHAKALLGGAAATSSGAWSNSNSNVEKLLSLGLTLPEAFILGFKTLPRARAKLSVMQLMKTFDGMASELEDSFATVRRALDQITGSGALAALLCEVLAVGNKMNEGTTKGDARAITVDSLLTLTKTKSHCKRMTVLDYIAESLLTKDAPGIAASSTANYSEIGSPSSSSSSFSSSSSSSPKTGRETLEFASELPDLDAASRLPISDLCQQTQQLQSALQGAKLELSALQTEAGGQNKATTVEARGGALAVKVTTRLSSSGRQGHPLPLPEPRAALMAMLQKHNGGTGGSKGLVKAMQSERRDEKRPMKQQGQDLRETRTSSEGEYVNEGEIARRRAVEVTAVISSLDAFVDRASSRLVELRRSKEDVRAAASRMTAFLGDCSQDAGHIFACLKQFAELTGAARDRHDKRVEDAARKARIAARQQEEQQKKRSGSSVCSQNGINPRAAAGSLTTTTAGRRPQRSIDPKADLMEEVRLRYAGQN